MVSGTSHRAGLRMSLRQKLAVAALALVSLFLTPVNSRAQDFGLGASAAPNPVLTGADRVALFLKQGPDRSFRRKDYLNMFPELSTATASRDLAEAVEGRILVLNGTKRQASYRRI